MNWAHITPVSPDCLEIYIRATFEAKLILRRTVDWKPSPSSREFWIIAESLSAIRSARSRRYNWHGHIS